jgi:hypothetical protein
MKPTLDSAAAPRSGAPLPAVATSDAARDAADIAVVHVIDLLKARKSGLEPGAGNWRGLSG